MAHIRQTLERARAAVREAHSRASHSRSLVERAEWLVGESERSVQVSTALRAELRTSIVAYVHTLRDDGLAPQRVVVLVKSAIRDATPPEFDAYEARALMDDAVRWSIEAYYDAA